MKKSEINHKINDLLFHEKKVKPYSQNRSLAACVVEKILFMKKETRDRFCDILNKRYLEMCKIGNYEAKHDLFLLWATPDEICKAAIISLQLNHRQTP